MTHNRINRERRQKSRYHEFFFKKHHNVRNSILAVKKIRKVHVTRNTRAGFHVFCIQQPQRSTKWTHKNKHKYQQFLWLLHLSPSKRFNDWLAFFFYTLKTRWWDSNVKCCCHFSTPQMFFSDSEEN